MLDALDELEMEMGATLNRFYQRVHDLSQSSKAKMDKQLKVYEGYFHETLNDTKERRERVKGEVVQWLEERLQKGGPPIRSRV